MKRAAVFVDAGYLYAQGSAALAGEKVARTSLVLDANAVVAKLKAFAEARSGTSLLRIYWYDAAPAGRALTPDHEGLAYLDNVKLRLGILNTQGHQKGVDTLIVTDLIELARNQAISDAVLVSGDEDVRTGVQIAQSFGVRVHLLAVVQGRGSQSPQLQMEADTTSEWPVETVASFLTLRTLPVLVSGTAPDGPYDAVPGVGEPAGPPHWEVERLSRLDDGAWLDHALDQAVAVLQKPEIDQLMVWWNDGGRGLPSSVDGPLLASCAKTINRELTNEERKYMRERYAERVKDRAAQP